MATPSSCSMGKSTTTSKSAPSWKSLAIDFRRTAIRRRSFAPSSNGTRSASADCVACLPWRFGQIPPGGWCWRAIVWASSRSTSRIAARTCFFGSELKAILAHPEIDRRLSLAGLDCYLSLNYVPAPWTLVDGIEKLLPGEWLEWLDGKVNRDAFWRLPEQAPRQRSLESAREELDSLLQQSVREHLISDVPLGVWLSGGIDSSAILHYASQASSSRLKTFSISFRGRSFD